MEADFSNGGPSKKMFAAAASTSHGRLGDSSLLKWSDIITYTWRLHSYSVGAMYLLLISLDAGPRGRGVSTVSQFSLDSEKWGRDCWKLLSSSFDCWKQSNLLPALDPPQEYTHTHGELYNVVERKKITKERGLVTCVPLRSIVRAERLCFLLNWQDSTNPEPSAQFK